MGENQIYRKGAIILREGSHHRDAYFIEKGQVEVSRRDEKGNKTVIAILGKNEVIGEKTLLVVEPVAPPLPLWKTAKSAF